MDTVLSHVAEVWKVSFASLLKGEIELVHDLRI